MDRRREGERDLVTDAIAELLLRHELGDFPPRVRARLEEIFTTDPPDALERLQRAATYLGIEGTTAETLERADAQSKARELAHGVSTTTSEKTGTVKREDVST
jgi:hypothetical protein